MPYMYIEFIFSKMIVYDHPIILSYYYIEEIFNSIIEEKLSLINIFWGEKFNDLHLTRFFRENTHYDTFFITE